MPAPRKPKEEMPADVREQVEKLEKLKDAHDAGLRFNAALALGEIGHASAVPHLITALRDRDSEVRRSAVMALGKIGHPSALPHLAKALADENVNVGTTAAEALGTLKDVSAVPPLVEALQNDSPVRWYAADALISIGRAIQGKPVKGKEAKALQLVAPHLRENEEAETIRKAYQAAFEGKVTKENARLYVKQLRAMKGSLK